MKPESRLALAITGAMFVAFFLGRVAGQSELRVTRHRYNRVHRRSQ